MEGALQSLRDIEGVLGSFVLDHEGRVLARDMPAMFDDPTLAQAGLRLSQLRSALEASAETFDGCTARFGGHLVLLRAADACTLCVLCPVGTNLNTLHMGLNLVARRVSGRRSVPPPSANAWPVPRASVPPAAPQTTVQAAQAPVPTAARTSPPPAAEPAIAPRFFRGRPVP